MHNIHCTRARVCRSHSDHTPGLQKLQGVASFSAMFLNYDLHAQRQVPFSYVYLHA